MKKSILFLSLLAAALSLSACTKSKDPAQSKLPWSRPASWEYSLPGVAS